MNSPSSPMMDNSQIGKFGTLSLMKQNDTVVTAFGIDLEELTFGRDQACGVRLCYPDVSPIHCKITFRERKAFLVVLGSHGLLIDGCKVCPNSSTSSPNTIPLSNNSEIEIQGKRFRFTYPPKEMRAMLLSTPTPAKRRALRLSMIESAEVFSPRPSLNPMENLRVLQSPLKPYQLGSRSSSPLKLHFPTEPTYNNSSDDDDEGDIILVEGNSPRVVEEENDLIILEDVDILPPAEEPTPNELTAKQYLPALPPMLVPPRTPITPRRPRNTLHKAVLIRSTQRAILQAEKKRDEEERDEEEEAEVFDTILEDAADEGDVIHENPDEEEDHELAEVDEEQKDDNGTAAQTWRISLERIWPFRRSASPTKPDFKEEEEEEKEKEAIENPAPLYPRLNGSVANLPIRGLFNTPQPHRQTSARLRFSPGPASVLVNQPRMSLGGGEPPRRIKVEEQPWKVSDLVVPPPPSSPVRPSSSTGNREQTPSVTQLSDAERRAIQERRRSAVRMSDNFFHGGIPGMRPSSPAITVDRSSPVKGARASIARGMNEDHLDTRSLLEKMRETVESAKAERRASMATSSSPQKHVEHATISATTGDNEEKEEEEFSLLRSPTRFRTRFSEESRGEDGGSLPTDTVQANADKTSSSNGVESLPHSTPDKASRDLSPHKTRNARTVLPRGKPVETPSLADDEASPADTDRKEDPESDDEGQVPKKPAKLLRGRGNPFIHETSNASKLVVKEPPQTEVPMEVDEPREQPDEAAQMLKPKAQASTTPERSRSPSNIPRPPTATVPTNSEDDSTAVNKATGRTTGVRRTTRKASVEPDTAYTATDNGGAPARRTRARSRSKVPEESDTDTSSMATTRQPPRRATRTRGKTPASEVETDDDKIQGVGEEATVTKTKRGRRPKTADVPDAIKEEETDEPHATTKTATRAKKGVSASTLHPASGPKGRSKKVTASATDVPKEAEGDKENAGSEDESVIIKTKIGRPRKAPVKIKEEVQTEPEMRSGTKTRAMRTRSKT
ncbi:hypothetical protein D9757_008110 [Collybiopsis confluens]|uniref:FHA domain-containing protein n=1 Tax=Collybiopsis confluens TaxID=2823264 RepID=A0A8H5H6X1_9AGAR|nr:hypothetical protein D9757_008110 [Collybiopsis confluens]